MTIKAELGSLYYGALGDCVNETYSKWLETHSPLDK